VVSAKSLERFSTRPVTSTSSRIVVVVTGPRADIVVTLAAHCRSGDTETKGSSSATRDRVARRVGPCHVANVGKASLTLGRFSVARGFTLVDPLVASRPSTDSRLYHRADGHTAPHEERPGFHASNDPYETRLPSAWGARIGFETEPLPENHDQRHATAASRGGGCASAFLVRNVASQFQDPRSSRSFRFANDGNATRRFGGSPCPLVLSVL